MRLKEQLEPIIEGQFTRLKLWSTIVGQNENASEGALMLPIPWWEMITEADVKELLQLLATTTTLTDLDLSGNKVGIEGARLLAAYEPLKKLNLSDNRLGSEVGTFFGNNTTLESLNLNSCMVGVLGSIELAKNSTLTELRISDNYIETRGVLALASNKKLKILDIYRNADIYPEAVIALAENTTLRELYLGENFSQRNCNFLIEFCQVSRLGIKSEFTSCYAATTTNTQLLEVVPTRASAEEKKIAKSAVEKNRAAFDLLFVNQVIAVAQSRNPQSMSPFRSLPQALLIIILTLMGSGTQRKVEDCIELIFSNIQARYPTSSTKIEPVVWKKELNEKIIFKSWVSAEAYSEVKMHYFRQIEDKETRLVRFEKAKQKILWEEETQRLHYIFRYDTKTNTITPGNTLPNPAYFSDDLKIRAIDRRKIWGGIFEFQNEVKGCLSTKQAEGAWVFRFPKGNPLIDKVWKSFAGQIMKGTLWAISATAISEESETQSLSVYVANIDTFKEAIYVLAIIENICASLIINEPIEFLKSGQKTASFSSKDARELLNHYRQSHTMWPKAYEHLRLIMAKNLSHKIVAKESSSQNLNPFYGDGKELARRKEICQQLLVFQVNHPGDAALNIITRELCEALTTNLWVSTINLISNHCQWLDAKRPGNSVVSLFMGNSVAKNYGEILKFLDGILEEEQLRLAVHHSNTAG